MFPPNSLPPITGAEALSGKSRRFKELAGIWDKLLGEQKEKRIARTRSNYYGMLRLIDDQFKRLIKGINERGLDSSTYIIYLSDHGDFVGEYGLLRKGGDLSELLTHITTVWRGPDVVAGKSAEFISLIDFLPTVCSLIGAEIPDGVQGKSIIEILKGDNKHPEEFDTAYCESGYGGLDWNSDDNLTLDAEGASDKALTRYDCLNSFTMCGKMRALRMGDYKIQLDSAEQGFLYNIKDDPLELHNLWQCPEYLEIKTKMLSRLATEMMRHYDPLPYPHHRYRFKKHKLGYQNRNFAADDSGVEQLRSYNGHLHEKKQRKTAFDMIKKITLLIVLSFSILCLLCSCSKNNGKVTEKTELTAPEGTQIVLSYISSNNYAGTVTGQTQQVIEYGITKSSEVIATPNLGYKFVQWSDGNTSPTRIGDMPGQPTEYVAEFALDTKELPILYIITHKGSDIVSKDQYVDGSISVFNCGDDDFDNLKMQIRGRGNYTWNSTFNKDPMYNKRPYRVKLSEQKQLCGVGSGKSNDWVLLADHCDQSLLRNNIVYTFAASMPAIYWQPHVRSVEVYLNGQYNGVYLLSEHVEVNKNKVNVTENLTDPESGFLAMYSNYTDLYSFEGFGIYDDNYGNMPYEIKSDFSDDPDIAYAQKEYIIDSISRCWDAIRSGNEQTIRELIDIDSVIDTYIVQELFKNLDTGHDNFYMYKDKGGKLILGPVWDFDQCAGNANEDVDNPENIRGGKTQPWYIELLRHSWFKKLVRERWNSLKGAIDTIPGMIINTAKAGYNSYCRNFEKWQIFGYKINRETYVRTFTSYNEHYEFFSQFMSERIKWLNSYFNSPTYAVDIKDKFDGKGTKEDPYIISSAEDFIILMQKLSSGESFGNKCFLQTADIDIGNTSGIGAPYVFAGFYNGNGYSITADIRGNDGSLFPYVTGVIINVTAKGRIENSAQAGGIVRSLRVGGAIVNCISYMNIKNGSYAAGIAASNQEGGNSTISNTFFGGTIDQGGVVAPICPWNSRRPGDFINNYYIKGTANDTANINIAKEEFEISASDVQSKLAEKMNSHLSEVSNGMFFFDEGDLCTWVYENGEIRLVTKE